MATVLTNHEEVDTADEKFGKEQFFNGLETLVVENILDTRETQVSSFIVLFFCHFIVVVLLVFIMSHSIPLIGENRFNENKNLF